MSLSVPELLRLSADYGCDVRDARALASMRSRIERSERIETRAHYVGACMRLARRLGRTLTFSGPYDYDIDEYTKLERIEGLKEGRVDPRLVAVGFQHEKPSAWVRQGRLWAFLAYYERATTPGRAPGSTYNQTPERVYCAWRSGVPADAVRLHVWQSDRIAPVKGRQLKRLRRALRAARRTSSGRERGLGLSEQLTTGALAQLGRLSPELQRALIHVSGGLPDRYARGFRPMAAADLRWDLLAPIARAIATDPRIRIAWSAGRRQAALLMQLPSFGRGLVWDDLDPNTVSKVMSSLCRGERPYLGPVVSSWLADVVVAWLTPETPRVSLEVACRLLRGETAEQISGLLEPLASRWLRDAPQTDPQEFASLYAPVLDWRAEVASL